MLEPFYPDLVYTFVKDPLLRPRRCALLVRNSFITMGMHREGSRRTDFSGLKRAKAMFPQPPAETGPNSDIATERPAPPPRGRSGSLGLWLRDLVFSALASVLIITFLYQPVRVEGTSMLPRLEDRDRLFINKFVYHIEAISRGDIVVFRYPGDEEKSYIKRVIGLPGDRLHIIQGQVFINGQPVSEPYVPDRFRDDSSSAEIAIPPDHYFMMGDHRSVSQDSRAFGPVARELIYGKAVFVYWPAKDAGVVR
jgi:signal peptidase I